MPINSESIKILMKDSAFGISTAREVGMCLLARNDATLAVAESCTGGLVGALITETAGCSAYFLGGVIAYANAVKINVLNVPSTLLQQYGAVSEEVARAMAEGVRRRFCADYSVAVTGIAGPGGGTPGKPVGTVWLAACGPEDVCTERLSCSAADGRRAIREQAALAAMMLLLRLLNAPGLAG